MKIKTGIVGFGNIAKTHCLANAVISMYYDNLPFEVRIGKILRKKTDKPLPFFAEGYARDLDELIADSDVVDICSPNAEHYGQAKAVLSANKPLYLEKPVCKDMAGARETEALAESRGTLNQVALMYRFMPGIVSIRDRIARGDIGRIINFNISVLHSGYLNPARKSNWKLKREQSGGGPLLDIGVHLADVVRFIFGKVSSVRCETQTIIKERPDDLTGAPVAVDVEDIASAQVYMDAGFQGRIEITRVASVLEQSSTITVYGTEGSICFTTSYPDRIRIYSQKTGKEENGKVSPISDYAKYLAEIAPKGDHHWMTYTHTMSMLNFYLNVVNGKILYQETPTIGQAVAAQEIIDACYRSADQGAEIVILPAT